MIKETNLRFNRAPRMRQSTDKIIIHHSASHDVGAATIHQWHLDRGWLGIGYHFVIRQNGAIERGREEGSVGAHAGPGANADSVGVCLAGNLDQHSPAKEQLESLAWLVGYLFDRYGELTIKGHSDVMPTACPGQYFPWNVFKKKLEDFLIMDETGKYFTDVADGVWYAEAVNKMYEEGLIKGYGDGTFKPDEPVTRAEMAVLISRIIEYLR